MWWKLSWNLTGACFLQWRLFPIIHFLYCERPRKSLSFQQHFLTLLVCTECSGNPGLLISQCIFFPRPALSTFFQVFVPWGWVLKFICYISFACISMCNVNACSKCVGEFVGMHDHAKARICSISYWQHSRIPTLWYRQMPKRLFTLWSYMLMAYHKCID